MAQISRYKKNLSKKFDTLFSTDEEKAVANIALEVCSRLLFEYLFFTCIFLRFLIIYKIYNYTFYEY